MPEDLGQEASQPRKWLMWWRRLRRGGQHIWLFPAGMLVALLAVWLYTYFLSF